MMNIQLANIYSDFRTNLSREERTEKEIGISKRIEGHRLRLADIISRDEYLWDAIRPYNQRKGLDGISEAEYRELPKQTFVNEKPVTNYFANLEKRLHLYNYNGRNRAKIKKLVTRIFDARNELVEMNLLFVPYIIRDYYSLILKNSFMDILEEGNLGLIDAAHRFDYKRKYAFDTFAGAYIRMRITKAINSQWLIRIPEKERFVMREIHKQLYNDKSDRLDNEELAKKLGMDIKELDEYFRLYNAKKIESLSGNLDDDGDLNAEGSLADPNSLKFEEELLEKEFIDALKIGMSERDFNIIKSKIMGDITLEEVGARNDITRERVRQIIKFKGKRAIKRLDRERSLLGLNKKKSRLFY